MAPKTSFSTKLITLAIVVVILIVGLAPIPIQASSHREAPLIAMDPEADITDFYFFRSYEPDRANYVDLIMNVIPGEEPSAGPNYYNFDPNVLYTFNVDNNANGTDNVQFQFQFTTEFRGVNKNLGLFLGFVALPPITALDGAGSEGLGIRQKYTVTMIKNGTKTELASGLIAVPSNVGRRTMPDYPGLAKQGIYTVKNDSNSIRVFAGQRQDPFYIDLGGVFDTLNLRRSPLPLLTTAEDANDKVNPFGVDMLSGFNVNTIALEVPASMLTSDGKPADTTAQPVLGAYASTSRKRLSVQSNLSGTGLSVPIVRSKVSGQDWVQIQRLANPLVNEAIIGLNDKDRWNLKSPSQESQFTDYYLNPRLAVALQTVYNVPAASSNRTDLVNLLLKYKPSDTNLAELLRLNLKVAPVALANQHRLGPLAHDAAGTATPDMAAWPNGRRPMDDVVDVAIRVVGGNNYIQAMAGDGVNSDDAALPDSFPFLATPFSGFDRVHKNP
jgi:hypothetical protein